MSTTRRVGLLFGGRSVEHEVSLVSARGVARALADTPHVCVPIGVTHDGRWLGPDASQGVLEGSATRVDPPSADSGERVLLDPGGGGLLRTRPGRPTEPLALDVLFPLVHGWGGEDGRLQGAADLAGLPCVGAGVLGSAAGMDKIAAKQLFQAAGLPVCPWIAATAHEFRGSGRERVLDAARALGPTLFVKPANGGSSVGVTRVTLESELRAGIEEALAYDRRVLIERGVEAREVECAVLGNDQPQASVVGEIVPSREFYDYAAKYVDGTSRLLIPAPLDPALAERVRALSLEAFRVLDLAGLARVDFLLDRRDEALYLNEVNTLPGFTPISMFPKLWEATGLSYPRLVERLIELGLERAGAQGARRFRWQGV
ncbi:MAG TPA: D-alanine--D-alanine ligase family protein [Candidatus Polarisedimenticolaceae bacterium]|nr:D-alanine--D-alanine ligase family protein [Candidatus Polarisedimenticolaceae bacterium]